MPPSYLCIRVAPMVGCPSARSGWQVSVGSFDAPTCCGFVWLTNAPTRNLQIRLLVGGAHDDAPAGTWLADFGLTGSNVVAAVR